MMVLFAENICKQFGLTLRSGPPLGFQLFGTKMALLKDLFENVDQQQNQEKYPSMQKGYCLLPGCE